MCVCVCGVCGMWCVGVCWCVCGVGVGLSAASSSVFILHKLASFVAKTCKHGSWEASKIAFGCNINMPLCVHIYNLIESLMRYSLIGFVRCAPGKQPYRGHDDDSIVTNEVTRLWDRVFQLASSCPYIV